MSVNKINFNSDLGEQDRDFFEDIDQFLIPQINSANVSCLFHGGYKDVVLDVLKSCKQHNVSIGAHISFLDKKNFGRTIISWDRLLIHQLLKDQINFMKDMTKECDISTTHFKPHGALNYLASRDEDLAFEIVKFLKTNHPELIMLAPALSKLAKVSEIEGIPTALEVYADRTYEDDATLTPRDIKGSLITDPEKSISHIQNIIHKGSIISRSGLLLPTKIHSICLHSDTPNSIEISKQICILLNSMGISQSKLIDLI
ncbi:MAG: 5-oxoprolinase subunit PxpA [Alphaproteobacteria bacterium]